MQKDLLLDIQRKILGGYINAEEFGHSEILNTKLEEELFDLTIHKAVVRACNNLSSRNIPVSDYTVLDFIQSHNMPSGASQEAEYVTLMINWAITPKTFKHYISMILQHKTEEL